MRPQIRIADTRVSVENACFITRAAWPGQGHRRWWARPAVAAEWSWRCMYGTPIKKTLQTYHIWHKGCYTVCFVTIKKRILKVVCNEKEGRPRRWQTVVVGLGLWRTRFVYLNFAVVFDSYIRYFRFRQVNKNQQAMSFKIIGSLWSKNGIAMLPR